ncbi:caspase family protein [Caballeronia novacaledonica]|uniref:Caspase family protein n=1 Tax=Caballeronia novacaledonica TaxID=1544861 RepID=A0AA37IHA3_9BURK|nr:caspase family protein [Caballeronia novacaledonica]GJH26285.1 caspase family protein [Caballeronia novacaledonica]
MTYETMDYRSQPNEAYTHALVIGCGYPGLPSLGYPTLSGSACGKFWTPGLSASWFVEWLFGMYHEPGCGFENCRAPLGTVEFLGPEDDRFVFPGDSTASNLTTPKFDEIESAFSDWIYRISLNPHSQGIFYFCGHGLIDGEDHILLSDGFTGAGDGQYGVWHESFNMTDSVEGASRKVHGALYFFIDACMEFDKDVILSKRPPRGLIDWKIDEPVLSSDHVYLRGAKPGNLSFAPTDGVANFTRALLKVLSGFCGQQGGNIPYWANWQMVLNGTATLLRRDMQSDLNRQEISMVGSGNGSSVLRTSNNAPKVILGVDVSPGGYRPNIVVWADGPALSRREEVTLSSSHEDMELIQHIYQIGIAAPPGAAFANQERQNVWLLPPLVEQTFKLP